MKTVIEMAREAGFFPDWNWDRTNWHATGYSDSFEHLVELARADEREAAAKMVDHILKPGGGTWGDAIRARGSDAA
jgi:hypothetical protein